MRLAFWRTPTLTVTPLLEAVMPTVTLTVEPAAPAHGDTVTATYVVSGNDGIPAIPITVSGSVRVGDGDPITVDAAITLPGTDPLPELYNVPVADGLSFITTGDPRIFTALVP